MTKPDIDRALADLFAKLPASEPTDRSDLVARRASARATFLLLGKPDQGDVTIEDREVTVDGGTILVRVITPDDLAADAKAPAMFHLHGGAWSIGDLDVAEVELGAVAAPAGCVVVSVDYRLAPEHPFPIPLEDSLAAYRWMLANADELRIDVERIAIGGASAGGNLSAALCLKLRDLGERLPILQLLDVPAVDLTRGSPSMVENAEGYGLTAKDTYESAAEYVPNEADLTNPYASPLFAEDHSGLPPALILTAQYDPLRDDGHRYLAKLQAAGVPGTVLQVGRHFHGSWIIPLSMTTPLLHELKVAALKRAFAGTLVPSFG